MHVYVQYPIYLYNSTHNVVVSGQTGEGGGDEKIGGLLETTFTPTTGKIMNWLLNCLTICLTSI